ncbi:SDR family oxidoreductase [Formicincola oecophyllae]|uniref:SDR family oxidoreductase n=1 Tax=Formicincola oecophyllae TaxID=2558361 RepID=A0A4Y6UAN4_9PROT|nr:SDR family oxidoreductase [Formicincola oecophyllae]QDH13638.1 SDR family oxidoreductase [Formicincola oecophyllae]
MEQLFNVLRLPPTVPRVALVTGGARRIGRAFVAMLAEQGCAVAIHCHKSTQAADELAHELHQHGHQACVLRADLSSEGETATLMAKAHAALGGPVGILINNASVFERDEWHSATRQSWDRHLEPNLRAPFVLSQGLASGLAQAPEGRRSGLVINVLDQRVWNLTPHFVSYTVAKSALWTLTRTLALALAPSVRVNAVGPGPVLPAAGQGEGHFKRMCDNTPLRHGASPHEVAQAALALCCLPGVTGQMLAIDGGQHLNWGPPA